MAKNLYNDTVLDHFQNPRNTGIIEGASAVGNAGNPECGDVVRLYLEINDGAITQATVKVLGCPVAIAAASMLTVIVKGKTVGEALRLKNEDISNALGGLPAQKLSCSVLAEAVLRDALSRYSASPEASAPATPRPRPSYRSSIRAIPAAFRRKFLDKWQAARYNGDKNRGRWDAGESAGGKQGIPVCLLVEKVLEFSPGFGFKGKDATH
jgi:nitrogen fixation NifU-like protein